MRVDDFDYLLPEGLIAQSPIQNRSDARLLVVNKKTGAIKHLIFKDLIDLLSDNDCLVINDTKVYPARLFGKKQKTNAVIEVLLLKELEDNIWEALVRPAKRVKPGDVISFGDDRLWAKCIEAKDEGLRTFELIYEGILIEILEEIGIMPLPPYIHEKLKEKNRYQTVYAKDYGSAAAPTAGLHFTNELLAALKKKGIEIIYITLHVGLGTFRPVSEEEVEKHHMHSELYEMSENAAKCLNEAKAKRKRVIAVGTTSARTLESIIKKHGKFISCKEETDIFIYPPYEFKALDALITNFHLPKSTLLMLVSAFSSLALMKEAYQEAIKEEYRFFSFGDALLIE